MTGREFEQLMKANGYNQSSLAKQLGLVRQTIANCCKAEKVELIYAYAIKAVVYEKQAPQLLKKLESEIVNLNNIINL